MKNCALQSGMTWSLGGYVQEIGGKAVRSKKSFGICVPGSSTVCINYTITNNIITKYNCFRRIVTTTLVHQNMIYTTLQVLHLHVHAVVHTKIFIETPATQHSSIIELSQSSSCSGCDQIVCCDNLQGIFKQYHYYSKLFYYLHVFIAATFCPVVGDMVRLSVRAIGLNGIARINGFDLEHSDSEIAEEIMISAGCQFSRYVLVNLKIGKFLHISIACTCLRL